MEKHLVYLGVVPESGFLEALKIIKLVTIVKNDQVNINLSQIFFEAYMIGISHIPNKVVV